MYLCILILYMYVCMFSEFLKRALLFSARCHASMQANTSDSLILLPFTPCLVMISFHIEGI
jgi:hypothetical protein